MAYFPMFIDIEKKKCLVAGGGTEGGRGLSHVDYVRFLERKPGEEGRVLKITPELFSEYQAHPEKYNFPFRRGVDFYHHYKEDIALFGEMGFKTFRMSISWSPPEERKSP
jgi:6-phospho-beta-glucosidase